MTPLDEFKRRMATVGSPQVLLTGAKAWDGSQCPDHTRHVPHGEWIRSDIEGGEGVDFVADLQTIDQTWGGRLFDAIFSPATLEHIERPWVAMIAMGRILSPGGVLYLHTHQTFPLHGYPSDYFRFSEQAIRTMCFDAGLDVVACGYDSPCTITPPPSVEVWNTIAESYLNVTVCAVKK